MSKKIKKFMIGFIGGAIDSALSLYPPVAITWGAIKGGVNNIRTERAVVFLDYIVDNFSHHDFESEQFVDGFAISFQEYIIQRNKIRREWIIKIFNTFTITSDKENFELERMFDLLNKVGSVHIKLFEKIVKQKKNNLIIMEDGKYDSDYDTYKYLEYLGLISSFIDKAIVPVIPPDIEEPYLQEIERVCVTDFGKKFIDIVLN